MLQKQSFPDTKKIHRDKTLRTVGQSLFMLFLILLAVVYCVPLVWMILTSLKSVGELSTLPIKIFPATLQWQNYTKVFEIVPFINSYVNSLINTGLITVIVVITSSMAGYAFAKLEFPGRNLIFTGVLSTMMVPFFLLCLPLFYIFTQLNIINTNFGLILPLCVSAFGTFLMRQGIMAIPTEIIHAARIDGCSEFGIYARIILPLSANSIATLVIFTFMNAWDEFMWALLAAQGEKMWTLPLVIRQLQMSDQQMYHLQMAGATMAVLPLIIVFIFAQRQIIQSVALAGLKL